MGKPTIAELEAILDGPPCAVCINPDGSVTAKHRSIEDNYNELLLAVCSKFPGETRHQTALRYITDTEKGAHDCEEDKSVGPEDKGE